MSEDITEYGYNQKERMYPDFIKEAQAAYKESGDPVLGRFLSKKQGEYRVEDYYALPETCRVELIDGVIYNMAAPTNLHQAIITEIAVQLDTWMRRKKGKCMVMISPADVQLDQDDKTMVQPDIFVCCAKENQKEGRDKRKRSEKKVYRAFQGAPDLVVEVLSFSSRKRDRVTKYRKYREAGVREYWIVDPETRRITVHLLERGEETVVYTYQDEIPVHIYQGECRITLADMEQKEELMADLGLV
ncbi:MAG: Uma2 family endonuclease [Eubacteriales bacterium]|nr:Uma2 family endonuclease [Eubacteriales bacterium]